MVKFKNLKTHIPIAKYYINESGDFVGYREIYNYIRPAGLIYRI